MHISLLFVLLHIAIILYFNCSYTILILFLQKKNDYNIHEKISEIIFNYQYFSNSNSISNYIIEK